MLEAESGTEALKLSAGSIKGLIHLLFTDVVMPGMSGRTLADQLILDRPETRVLYMSGIHRPDYRGTRRFGGRQFLSAETIYAGDNWPSKVRESLDESAVLIGAD